jgi:hypothetical protein
MKKEIIIALYEKFITLIKQDKFDYTEWRKTLWEDKSLEEICRKGDVFSRQLRG